MMDLETLLSSQVKFHEKAKLNSDPTVYRSFRKYKSFHLTYSAGIVRFIANAFLLRKTISWHSKKQSRRLNQFTSDKVKY